MTSDVCVDSGQDVIQQVQIGSGINCSCKGYSRSLSTLNKDTFQLSASNCREDHSRKE